MSLVDFNLLRDDIAEFTKKIEKWQMKFILRYLIFHPNFKIKIGKINLMIVKENNHVFKEKELNLYDKPILDLNYVEKLYLIKVYRFVIDKLLQKIYKKAPHLKNISFKKFKIGKMPAEWQIPKNAKNEQVILFLHGGGFNIGSIKSHRGFTSLIAEKTKIRVLLFEYRLAPEYQYPCALDDCLTVYEWLIGEGCSPNQIILAGDSAGGGLVLSLLLKLKEMKKEMPNSGILFSPFTDLTFSGETFFDNMPRDPLLCDLNLGFFCRNYLNLEKVDNKDPLISPLFGDYNGLPPLLFIVSSTEMLYFDGKRAAEKAKTDGVEVQFEEWKDMVHVFPAFLYGLGISEVEEAYQKVQEFVKNR